MMAVTIPPWLDVKPSDFVQAAHMGAQTGVSAGEVRARSKSDADRIAAEFARINMEAAANKAELEAKVNASRVAHEEWMGQYELDAQRQAVDIEQNKLKNSMALDAASKKYQAQRSYQNFIDGGGDPVEGLLKFGPSMDEPMSGYAGLTRTSPSWQPNEVDVNGTKLIQSGPQHYILKPKAGEEEAGKVSQKARLQIQRLAAEEKAILAKYPMPGMLERPAGNPAFEKARQADASRLTQIRQMLNSLVPEPENPFETGDAESGGGGTGLRILSIEQVQ